MNLKQTNTFIGMSKSAKNAKKQTKPNRHQGEDTSTIIRGSIRVVLTKQILANDASQQTKKP